MVNKKAIANSLLFAGPSGIGKSLFAEAFAAMLVGKSAENHPDIHHYRPEGKLGLHSISALRKLCEEVYFPPYEANYKVFIIHEAERMLVYSANALLKTFEEPPGNTVIILLSSAPASLIPTVISRCRSVHFRSLAQEEVEQYIQKKYHLEPEKIQSIAGLSQGSIGRAVQLLEQKEDGIRTSLFEILKQGKHANYKYLLASVENLTEKIESAKKQTEEAVKEELYKIPSENMSAFHKQALEKELEGAVSLVQTQEMHALLDMILSWYRDLHLLHLGGKTCYLINLDYESQLIQVLQRGILPLKKVIEAIEEIKLALQRSTSINICLENLFLKLNLI